MKNLIKKLTTEDWIVVFAGAIILVLASVFPDSMPRMPKGLASTSDWISAGYMFLFVYVLTVLTSLIMGKKGKDIVWIFPSLLVIFSLTLCAQLLANIPAIKKLGFESVF